MKKIFIIIPVLTLMSLYLEGQSFKLIGGFKSFNYTEAQNQLKTGLIPTVGFGIESGFGSDNAMMVMDFMYSSHNRNFDFYRRNNYYTMLRVDADIVFKYKFSKFSSPFGFFGGTVGIVIPSRTDADGNKINSNTKIDPLWDYGPVLGAGMELFLKKYVLVLDGRYRFGLATLKVGGMKLKNNVLIMTVGIKF
jgi:hypothetical protein